MVCTRVLTSKPSARRYWSHQHRAGVPTVTGLKYWHNHHVCLCSDGQSPRHAAKCPTGQSYAWRVCLLYTCEGVYPPRSTRSMTLMFFFSNTYKMEHCKVVVGVNVRVNGHLSVCRHGDPFMVSPCLHPMTAGIGSSGPP